MEEATEIAKLRLFLALVASANKVDQLEPLPNIDFNIMSGNSLIGLMRVDENMFNTHYETKPTGKTTGKVIQPANLFRPETVQATMFAESHAKNYQLLINEKEAAINSYKNAHELGITDLQTLRDSIQESEKQANNILNALLEEEFTTLGIKYEEISWDETKNKEGKAIKRKLSQKDISKLEPFHWGYEFSQIFRKKDGFDAIITNPPWEIFQPSEKEFIDNYSDMSVKKMMNVFEFVEKRDEILKIPLIKKKWEEYCSFYPHQNAYFKKSTQYKNQISYIDDEIVPSKNNLYKLFVELCYNLLSPTGYCGIIVPNSIYIDAGTKQIRKLLYESTSINSLFGLANERFIFEGVDHRFRFCILTYQKGKKTDFIKVAFRFDPREAIKPSDLSFFLHDDHEHLKIPIALIRKISPDSLSIDELRSEIGLNIMSKLFNFPLIKEEIEDTFNLSFTTEFDKKSCRDLFETIKTSDNALMYSGASFHQYNHKFNLDKYYINIKKGRDRLVKKEGDIFPGGTYRLLMRRVARSSDTRTLIAAIIPPTSFCDNSVNYLIPKGYKLDQLLFVCAVFNSFVFDFIVRNKLNNNITIGLINQLPLPRLTANSKWYMLIVEKAAKLTCNTEEFKELWEAVIKTEWTANNELAKIDEQNQLRSELDAIIAHIYGLNENEFNYILSTFPIIPLSQKQAAFEYFKTLSIEFVSKNINADVKHIINKGESPLIEFKSTLRIDLKTNKPEKFIEHSVIKTLAAFLNSDGGTLIIGVEDDKNILGLELDFNSFAKPDKLDEFQKHFDNLISKTLGNRFHHYLKIDFPAIDGKTICVITIKEKSEEPVYVTNDAGQETFYIRRTASTIDLKPSDQSKYIKEHWK